MTDERCLTFVTRADKNVASSVGVNFAWVASMLRPLAVGVVVGAFVWPWLQVPVGDAAFAAMGLAVLGAWTRAPARSATAIFFSGVMIGFSLVAGVRPGPELRGDVAVRGVVVTAAEGRRADVELAQAGIRGEPAAPSAGRIRVIFPERSPPPGTAVLVAGKARRIDPTHLPGEPDPMIAAIRSGVRSEIVATDAVRVGLDRAPPDFSMSRHGALLRALVDGDAGAVDAPTLALLKRTGTWHLVSISGLHVGIGAGLGWMAVWLLTRPIVIFRRTHLLRWLCAAGGIVGACGYAELADWAVPARRAAWMTSAALLAIAGSRRPEAGRTLAVAAIAVVVVDPSSTGSLGFQLSFLAVVGMIVVSPRVTRLFPPDLPWSLRVLGSAVAGSAGATVGTLPVVALHLQSLSVLSPLANLWAVPWIGSIATPLAVFANALDGPPKRACLAVADAAVDIGLAGLGTLNVDPSAPAVTVVGALGLLGAAFLWKRAILALTLTVAILAAPRVPSADLVVTFLAIGQGDATLVEWPDGRRWLVDGGPPGVDLVKWLRARGITKLDTVFLSHLHPDHYGGLLPVFEGLRVERYVGSGLFEGQDVSRMGSWTTGHPDLLIRPAGYDDRDENNRSEVLRIRYGRRTLLLPGDAEVEEEAALVASEGEGLRADVLKLGHHGSRTSSTSGWLAAVNPSVAVASCGFDNRYGHPSPLVLHRLASERPDTVVWRTDLDGSVEVRTDGTDLRVRAIGVPAAWRGR